MATKLNDKQIRAKFLAVLKENDNEATATEMVKGTGLDAKTVSATAKALIGEGVLKAIAGGKVKLVAKAAPAAKVAPPKKAAPVEEEVEFDLSDDEEVVEGYAEEEFDLEGADDDVAGDDDDPADDGGDDDPVEEEDVAPAPKKKGKAKAAPATAAPEAAFSLAYKPIDTLTDEELAERIEASVEAAEALYGDEHVLVAEMLMRSVAKARRQVNKRA
jgi:hypothetical protein